MTAAPDPAPSKAAAVAAAPAAPTDRLQRPIRALRRVVATSLTFIAGVVLLCYPWLEWWDDNYFSSYVPVWSSGYLRGAISGLGAVSLVLALSSMARIRRR